MILVLAHKTIADGPISIEVLADSVEPWQRKFYCIGNLLNSQIYNAQSCLTTRIKFTGYSHVCSLNFEKMFPVVTKCSSTHSSVESAT